MKRSVKVYEVLMGVAPLYILTFGRSKMKKAFLSMMFLVVCGMLFVACPGGNDPGTPKQIIVDDITGNAIAGRKSVAVWISESKQPDFYDPVTGTQAQITAIGWGIISNNKLVVDLKVPYRVEGKRNTFTSQDWTGTGDYYIALIPISMNNSHTADYTGSGSFFYNFNYSAIDFYTGGDSGKVSITASPVPLDYNDFTKVSNLQQ